MAAKGFILAPNNHLKANFDYQVYCAIQRKRYNRGLSFWESGKPEKAL
jgi:hypothetical protein